jgi:hypothetical protein
LGSPIAVVVEFCLALGKRAEEAVKQEKADTEILVHEPAVVDCAVMYIVLPPR